MDKESSKATRSVTIACLRFQMTLWNMEENIRGLKPLVEEAAEKGAQIVVAPECALSGFAVHTDRPIQWEAFKSACEPVDGPRMREVGEWAEKLGIYLAVGYMEIDGEHRYNSCAFWGPDGKLIGNYRKTHIGYPEQNVESQLVDAGNALPVYDTDIGRIGILICMDRYYPEATLTLAAKGAEIILMPSTSNPTREEVMQEIAGGARAPAYPMLDIETCHKEHMLRTRAADSACVWAEAHSLKGFIIDQRGRILARGNHRDPSDEVIIATTTLEDRNRLRAVYLRSRRPDLYEF